MHLSHIPQCTIQNRNVHIPVVNGALWDMGQVHCGIYEIGLLKAMSTNDPTSSSVYFFVSSLAEVLWIVTDISKNTSHEFQV